VHHAVVARTGAEVAAVHGLDGADARERVPAQAAAGLGPGGAQRGPGVGGEHAAGDPGALGGLAQPARVGQLGDRDGVGVRRVEGGLGQVVAGRGRRAERCGGHAPLGRGAPGQGKGGGQDDGSGGGSHGADTTCPDQVVRARRHNLPQTSPRGERGSVGPGQYPDFTRRETSCPSAVTSALGVRREGMTDTTETMTTPRTDDAQGSGRRLRAAAAGGALVALDIDGTLLRTRAEVPDVVVGAVAAARRAGHHVVLASGRSLVGVLPVARRLGIHDGWVVTSNGAVVARLDASCPGGYELDTVRTFDVEPVIRRARSLVPAVQVGVEEIGRGYRVTSPFDPAAVNGDQRQVPDAELWEVPATRVILRGEGAARLVEPLRSLGVTPVPAAADWVDVTPRD